MGIKSETQFTWLRSSLSMPLEDRSANALDSKLRKCPHAASFRATRFFPPHTRSAAQTGQR
jgi:hypothetical protein